MANPFNLKNGSIFREANIRFRYKVMLGVGLSLAAALFSGANAIYNVRQVSNSVNFSAESASPLLIGVISLSESYQKLQSVFDPVMKNCAGLEGASRYLASSEMNQRTKLEALKKLAFKADALTELSRYEFSGKKIFRTRQALLDICHDYTNTKSHISSAETAVKFSTSKIGLEAAKNIIALESRFNKLWVNTASMPRGPLGATIASEGASGETTAIWRRIRDFYKMRILVTELAGVTTLLNTVTKKFDHDRLRKIYDVKMSTLERTVDTMGSYYLELGQAADYSALSLRTRETKSRLSEAPRSLFAGYATLLEIERTKQNLVLRLQREQGQYSVALLNIMDVAQRINRNAQQKTERDAARASWEIAASMILAGILALVIGWYFKRAVTRPLEALTGNVSALGQSFRDEDQLVDTHLLNRGDEIGDLALQFSLTFQALSKARRELQESSSAEIGLQHDRLNGAIENMPQGLYMLDKDGRIIVANRRLAHIYNLDGTRALVGMTVEDFIRLCREKGAGVTRVISDDVMSTTHLDETYSTTQRVVELDDHRTMTMKVTKLPDGGYVVTHEDITDKQAANEKIAHMALHDGLTNLANRTMFRRFIDEHLESAMGGSDAALLFLDLDRFKIVNDSLGHPIGDALLVEAASRLLTCIGSDCFAARLGGDEFAIYQTGSQQPQGAEALAADILRAISEPFEIDGHHIIIGTSVGIALTPRDAVDADELLKNADMALYRAKQEGRGSHRFFEPEMDRKMRDWHEMEHDLRDAIANNEFELYYQPLVALDDEHIIAFEALIRWHHPRRGFVSPAEFIPVAEETGMINEIGGWILNTACAQATQWPEGIVVAVNVSPVQFRSGHLPLKVMTALNKAGLNPERLMLEITEGVFLNDTEQTMGILDQLKLIGIGFAMDDFGTGYSSLSYLRKFPFNKIKIDQSFVRDLSDNPESVAIVRAVTNLCKDLGMKTTAEGVETLEQADILRGLGCELAQGYYFGRPMPAAKTLDLFANPLKHSA